MLKIKLLIAVTFFAFSVASADECGSAKSQIEINACAHSQFSRVDAELNKVYVSYRMNLNDSQKKQLKDAQLAWVKYRDLVCTFESSGVEGGSAQPMVFQQCLTRKTQLRLSELMRLTECKEGDLSCPVWK